MWVAAISATLAGVAGPKIPGKFLRSTLPVLYVRPGIPRTYTVKWTGARADNRVEIDLFYCGPGCGEVRYPAV